MKRKWLFVFMVSLMCLLSLDTGTKAVAQKLIVSDDMTYMIFDYALEESGGDCLLYYYVEFNLASLIGEPYSRMIVSHEDNAYDIVSVHESFAKEDSKDSAGNIIFVMEDTVNLTDRYDLQKQDIEKVYIDVIGYYPSGIKYAVRLEGTDLNAVTPTPEPTLEPTPTNTPTPINTPKPTATSTPKPTPTNTPTPTSTPTPTNTPTPTSTPTPPPTNTPTPSPTPAPMLKLNAYFDENGNTVAEYETGGCTPVKSSIEFYRVHSRNGNDILVEQKQFVSGAGIMNNDLNVMSAQGTNMDTVYRYKLTYTFRRNGVQYTEFIWSDDLVVEREEKTDRAKHIKTFPQLVSFVWNDLFGVEMELEGYKFTWQQLFFYVVLAGIVLSFVFKFLDR